MGLKFFKWKYFAVTGFVCLLPILLGLLIWDKLPDIMPIHFDINNNPDNFASKEFAVLGLPVLMVIFQGIVCFETDLNAKKHGESKKIEIVSKWIIPVVTIVLQLAVFGVALNYNVDIRIVAMSITGVLFLVLGIFLPELDYIKNYNISPEKAKKINRFVGYGTVLLGLSFLLSIFFPPIVSVFCLLLLIPYTIAGVIYGIYVVKKK
ncbi:MAG: DUF1648 domain-containing protein [Clostridia bacterium]|nr:DUF1648 domain-containing protein [Clostridia bacterium]